MNIHQGRSVRGTIALRNIQVPDFGVPEAVPEIPTSTYAMRAARLTRRAGTDWVVVYADREHVANMMHLTGFEPRFEEAIVVLGRDGTRAVLLGNETLDYAADCRLPGANLLLCQSLSLMGQDRGRSVSIAVALRQLGIASGDSVGLIGWKYAEPCEFEGFVLPHHIVAALTEAAGDATKLLDVTHVMMDPGDGERSIVDADQIAVFEWASARTSAAVWRIVSGAKPGMTEMQAASLMGYAGEPLSCHMMMSSSATGPIVGLRSPRAEILPDGGGVTTAVGYWGALSSRAGMLSRAEQAAGFLDRASGYFSGLVAWYEAAGLGVAGGDIHEAVTAALARHGLRPALNPGHLVSYDEWSNTPVRPQSPVAIRSGMPFQVDVIPTPMPAGHALNCEDTVVFADDELRREIARRHPDVWRRIEARREFIAAQIGLNLKPEILPLSNTPLCLAPDWSRPDELLALVDA